MTEPIDILRRYWGHREFRPLQQEIIKSILEGQDTLALLPTGGGKSLCFQVPALLMNGLCLVITPLISLMKDQVEQLNQKGIPALALHTGMSWREVEKAYRNVLEGQYKFLYLSPERIRTRLFTDYLGDMNVSMITVDEAHCICQWGYDFRPAYLHIGELRSVLPGVPVLAVTATATRGVREDIQVKLEFPKSHLLAGSFSRPNLSYAVYLEEQKTSRALHILARVPGSAIIFSRTRKRTMEIAARLNEAGISADHYHGGLDMDDRNKRQEAWIQGHTRVMVCTNAFGMGIDKPDVRLVLHYDMPESPEAYYQEAGRAGRDGERSYAVLLWNRTDTRQLEAGIELHYPPIEKIREVYRALVGFLGIPAGSGEGLSFDFDLEKFTRTFHLNLVLVSHVLRLLEREEVLGYQELSYLPSRVSFRVSKPALYRLEKEQPSWGPLINALLRTYEGIFDNYVSIAESKLAYLLQTDVVTVVRMLRLLKSFDVIDYQPKRDKPQIFLLQERIVVDRLQLDIKRIHARKKSYAEGIHAIGAYAQSSETCRSEFLLDWLGAAAGAPCGVCDVCRDNRRVLI